jgi:hypothetical protein
MGEAVMKGLHQLYLLNHLGLGGENCFGGILFLSLSMCIESALRMPTCPESCFASGATVR